ncbi:hypothetical protein SDC9_29207 [bioreactor metagenome]|uniref:Peptidase C1A papain C-terminal domain-containing protein n=1 Tax=bioreactor metagenome TaxID=1076179 RepID=A0A644UWE5_9ZZZZ|nr:lectin like domain-containing protein [Methanocorpusculum sp.]
MSRTLLPLAILLAALLVFPAAADLPVSYDMRDKNLTPVITDQGNFGLCWVFASLSSLESGMIQQDPDKYAGIDLSAFHTAYYTYNRDAFIDPASPWPGLEGIAGDYTHIEETDLQDNISGLMAGGELYQAVYTLAAGFGAVNESAVPFYPYGNNTAPTTVTSGIEIVLDSALFVPYSEKDTVKTMILEKGAAAFGFFFNPVEPYLEELENGDWMYSFGDTGRENLEYAGGHAVLLIGWDDAFPKEQFNVTPNQDGAWLVQNSWGSNLSNSTYIWMSYDEVFDPVVFFLGAEPWFGHIYQYDGGTLRLNRSLDQTSAAVGNVFTAGGDEEILAVSLDTNQSVNYTMYVYTDPEAGKPDAGTLLAEQRGTIAFPGYYTIRLDDPVQIETGQEVSVVYLLEAEEPVNISIDTSAVLEEVFTTTLAQAGQSFLRTDAGEWEDLSADGETNLRIKAFTTDLVFWIEMDRVSVSIRERGVCVSGTTNFAPGREILVKLVCPDGKTLCEPAEVRRGAQENVWEVRFFPVKLTEEEFCVSAERNEVLMESGFVPSGFKEMLVFGAKGTIMPAGVSDLG